MKILIDIGHPGHVHLFRHFAKIMINKGHDVLFTCRHKEFEIELLEAEGFSYVKLGKHYKTKLGKLWGLFKFDFKMLLVSIKYKPNIFISHGSIYASHAAFFLRKTHIALEDTGNMEQVRLYLPFSKKVLVPRSLHKNLGKKEVRYRGIHELFYLHPSKQFFNEKVYDFFDSPFNKKIALVRLVAWTASHDQLDGNKGIGEEIDELISVLEEKNIQIIISSEGDLPKKLEKYKLKFPPELLHSLLKISTIYVGEGGTTATEASLLGTPSILINPQAKFVGSHRMLQNEYELQFYFDSLKEAMPKIKEIIDDNEFKETFKSKLDIFLNDHIDCTDFLVDFIEKENNFIKYETVS